MFYILISLVLASLFGLAVDNVYGSQGLRQYPWVDYTFWWIIGSGVALAAITPMREKLCQLLSYRLPVICHHQR